MPERYLMRYKEIIKTAWHITNNEPGLVWYGIIPAFFKTLVGLGMLSYQFFAFQISPFFGDKHFDLHAIKNFALDFIGKNPTVVTIIIFFALIIVALNFLVPPLCQGGLIGLISLIHREKEFEATDGIKIGIHHFLRMFELQLAVSVFSFMEFLTIFSFGVRHLGTPTWLIVVLSIIFVAIFFLSFLFIYTPNFIVLESQGLTQAFMSSAKLVISNFGKTFLVWLLILLISVRVIINIFLIFLIPAIVVFVMNFFISTIALTIGIIVGIIVSFGVLFLTAYLTGVLHVFTTTAWTLTFLSLDYQRPEKLLNT